MRKLFFSFIFFWFSIPAFGQISANSICPSFSLLTSDSAVIDGRISIIAISNDGDRYENGTIKENLVLKEKLNFKWKISPEFEFNTAKPWIDNLKNVSGAES